MLIGKKSLSSSKPAFIVAEVSGNHNGSLNRAIEIVKAVSRSGADAIKLQTYTADSITLNSESRDFKITKGPWKKYKNLWNLYHKAHTPWDWHERIFDEAEKYGLQFFSSPFDESSVDFLEQFNVCAYKIASPEINHIPLLKRVAKTNKPIILSTGLAKKDDINLAIGVLRSENVKDIVIMKCNSAYPAPLEELNLKTIPDLAKNFSIVPGFSDHSLGSTAAIVARSLGALIIEKHFNLDDKNTVDSFFSLEEKGFTDFVKSIRDAEKAMGEISYDISPSSQENLSGMRSIYVSKDIPAGGTITEKNIKCVRPAFGMHPKNFFKVLNKKTNKDLFAGDRLQFDDLI